MGVISIQFFVFIAFTVALYYCIPLRFRWFILLLSSVGFILSGNNLKMVVLMLIMIGITYLAGILLDKKRSRIVVTAAVIINAGILLILKETNFLFGTIRAIGGIAGQQIHLENVNWLAPLGISYYTLSMISYLLDIYWGVGNTQKNFFKFALFAGYFPALTSGPVLRYREIEQHLYMGHRFDYQKFCFGVQRMLWGVFKKLVISERLAIIVNTIYGDYNTYAGGYIFIAIFCFVFQLYTDFSGCIDIVLGASELFGVTLPENFQTPFFSRNLSEFWRRWHITLGAWLKDYILYPILKTTFWQKMGEKLKKRVGKKYGKKVPVWMGMFISWFLIGMWHGGSWNYIIGVGLFMWLLIVLSELFGPLFQWVIKKMQINTECFSWKMFQSLRTFVCFAMGLSLFRSYGGFAEGMRIWKSAFSTFNPWIFFDGSLLNLGLDAKDMLVLMMSLMILGISGMMREYIKRPIREWLAEQNLIFRWVLLYLLLFSVIIFGCYGLGYDSQAFIYQQF